MWSTVRGFRSKIAKESPAFSWENGEFSWNCMPAEFVSLAATYTADGSACTHTGWPKTVGHTLMTAILSTWTDLKKPFHRKISLENLYTADARIVEMSLCEQEEARESCDWGTMGVNSLPKTVTRQRRGCDLNPGPSAPESSTLTTRRRRRSSSQVSW